MRRREFVGTVAAAPVLGAAGNKKRIACLSSTYHVRSHSDNFITRFLEGYWIHEKYYEPPFEVASLWMHQRHPADIGTRLASAYGVRLSSSIEDALTLGTGKLAVDGVILVCEHGNYPHNEKQQQLYPRFEFFEQVVRVFKSSGRSCPVFVDKHLSYDWAKAKQMYDWSRELGFPFMAGSSVPVTFRRPPLDPPRGIAMESAMSVGGGWVADGGIFHILETLQAFAERRKGAEVGVRAVQMVTGDAVWKAEKEGMWNRALLNAALSRGERVSTAKPEDGRSVLGVIDYNDGFRGTLVAMGHMTGEYLAAYQAGGKIESTLCYIPSENSNNFSMLVHGITQMIATGKPSHPVERTLLVTGTLAALMESRYVGEKRIETPHLKVRYEAPLKSWYAPGIGS